jgi:uncharacterized membrane protein (UPF0182 family)
VFLFSLPAYTLIKNWMLLTLVLSALFAGTIYWVRGDTTGPYRRQRLPTVQRCSAVSSQ